MNNNKVINAVFAGIVLLGILVRLYHFDAPIADWHSWRQADTSSVSRNFVKDGFDILHPRFDDLSNVPSGMDNPQGYRFVEFPLFNIFQAGGYVLFNVFTLEEWGRIVSINASVLAMSFIFLLTRRHFNAAAALFSAFFYAVIPYSIYYGRTILPDVSMTAAILGGIYFFDRWAEGHIKDKSPNRKHVLFYTLSLVFTASAFLLKPYALFFTLPLLYLAFSYFGFSFLKKWQLWLYLVLALVPLVLWRFWMTQYPEGIPSNAWLFNAGDIRFKGAYFFWIFADRIGRLILGYWGIGLLVVGLVTLLQKEYVGSFRKGKAYFFISFLLSTLLYLVIIARGNVQHDYYQILIIPTIAMLLGIGASYLLELPKKTYYPFTGISVILLCSIFMLMFGWYHIREFYNINNPAIISAGQAVDKLTPKDAKVLANYNGDTTFLYQTNRQGWASYTYDMPKMVELGAEYFVLVHPQKEEIERFSKEYPIVEKTDEFILFDLQP